MAQNNTPVKIYLLENKIYSEDRAISKEEALEFAQTHNMSYFEISALKGAGFEDFKNDLIETIRDIFCA